MCVCGVCVCVCVESVWHESVWYVCAVLGVVFLFPPRLMFALESSLMHFHSHVPPPSLEEISRLQPKIQILCATNARGIGGEVLNPTILEGVVSLVFPVLVSLGSAGRARLPPSQNVCVCVQHARFLCNSVGGVACAFWQRVSFWQCLQALLRQVRGDRTSSAGVRGSKIRNAKLKKKHLVHWLHLIHHVLGNSKPVPLERLVHSMN